MMNNRVLVIVNSVYQLLTAVHMKRSILSDREADLVVTDMTPGLTAYVPRLKESRLFERVISAATQEMQKKYGAAKDAALDEAFVHSREMFRWMLNGELGNYVQVYFANFDLFTRILASWYYLQPCEFVWYEDGFSSYVIDYLRQERAPINRHPEGARIREKVERVYLYEPRLAMRGDGLRNCALPKIQSGDTALQELLNFIFDYQPPQGIADFIFLEQSFRAEGLKNNDIQLMEECRDAVGPGCFLVKPHPRNPENLPYERGLTRKYPGNVPWELFLLNGGAAGKTVLTVCSNAALTSRLVFGMDVNTVMLYKLFQGKVLWKEDEVLWRYLRTFHRQFAGKNYYVPQTVYELRSILGYLGGRHDEQ